MLFGTPQAEPAACAKIADKLPVKFLDDGVEVGGKAYRGADVGLVMVYPNPLNPERYVLLLPEDYGGGSPLQRPGLPGGQDHEVAQGRAPAGPDPGHLRRPLAAEPVGDVRFGARASSGTRPCGPRRRTRRARRVDTA